jgi:hypothetical protein
MTPGVSQSWPGRVLAMIERIERFREKWKRFSGSEARPNKDLEQSFWFDQNMNCSSTGGDKKGGVPCSFT